MSAAGTAFAGAVTHAPENAAYGLMAMAPLGAAFAPQAMGLALLGAVVASAVGSLAGSGRLVGDAGAALALLTAGLVAALLPHMQQGAGSNVVWQVLPLVTLGIASAGVLIALFGLLRIGNVVKFTPYAVRLGLSSGVGLLLIASAAPTLLGQRFGAGWSSGAPMLPAAAAVGLCALGITWWATKRRTRIPPVLLGLACATGLQQAMRWLGWGEGVWVGLWGGLGPVVGVPALPAVWLGGLTGSTGWLAGLSKPAVLLLLGSFALTAAVIASLDALLAASVIDGRLRRTRNANRELIAQGMANVASALAGGLPASPTIPASLGLVGSSPHQRHIVLMYAAGLLGVLLAGPVLLGAMPVSAVGGVLTFLGVTMISPTLWQVPRQLLQQVTRRNAASPQEAGRLRDVRRLRHLLADWAVLAVVAGSGLVLGLAEAVLIGAALAVLLFVRSTMRDVVRRVWSGDARHSLKTRSAKAMDSLQREGHRLAVLELEGALFFGTADALRDRLHTLAPGLDTAILDLHQVGDIDGTAARILCETAENWEAMGKTLLLAEWAADDPRRDLLETVAAAAGPVALRFENDADHALERAEEALLERLFDRLQIGGQTGALLRLDETSIARGLDAPSLALLSAAMTSHAFPSGHVVFRVGDPGDALYVSVAGEIGLRVPGSTRRLASFAPGVTVGEIAVLARSPRSAEAFAETDITVLRLTVEAFEHLMQQHPQLAAQLFANIALHLSDRVRVLTGDLAAWMARSGAGRSGSAA